MRAQQRFRHVISLGYFCSTALELQRYGLRDGSYPFDWNISTIRPTLAMVESGFGGFLERDRLYRDAAHPGIIRDTGSGINLYNDFDPALSIEEQYEVVRKKYSRRIQRFQRATTEPTLFVRYMLDFDEFAYLDANMSDVMALLRRTNPQNDLLLVGNADLPTTCGGLKVYAVAVDDGDVVARKFMRKNAQLSRRLLGLNYPLGLRLRNLLKHWLPLQRLRKYLRLGTRLRNVRRQPSAQ